jgi:hypothetical protein
VIYWNYLENLKNQSMSYLKISIFLFAICLLGCNNVTENGSAKLADNDAYEHVASIDQKVVLFSDRDSELFKKTFPRKFEQVPSVAVSEDGRTIFVAYYSGGEEAGPGNFVTVSVSSDKGENWKNDQLVVFPANPAIRIFDPGLWRDKEQNIHLFFGTTGDSLLWDGFGGVNEMRIGWEDDTINHSDPVRLADGVMINKPIFIKAKGVELFATYIDKPTEQISGKGYPKNGSFIFSSHFSASGEITLAPYSSLFVPDSIKIHDEPQLVETGKDKELLVFVRTTKGIYYARSDDYGKTWSQLLPFQLAGPTTSSRSFVGKLNSGNLLMISNNSTERKNMTAFLSKDGGNSWPYRLLLDERDNVSYPDADQSEDGTIHVVFDRDRTGDKDILYCRFTEEDILKNTPQKVFKVKVNKQ